MELTAWQKICHRILGKVFKKRARNDTTLSEDLVKGNMPIMPEVYMAQLFVTTVAVTIICGMLLAGIFMPDIGLIAWYESRPDLDYALACYEWEYWNADLVDETLESRGCPYFQYMVFPPVAKILVPIFLGLVVPFGTYKYLKGSAARSAHARGVALEDRAQGRDLFDLLLLHPRHLSPRRREAIHRTLGPERTAANRLVTPSAHAHDRDRDIEMRLDPRDITPRRLRELFQTLTAGDVLFPAVHGLVNRFGRSEAGRVHRYLLMQHAVLPITDTDL